MIFLAPGTLVDPPLAPTVRGLCCPLAPPSDHWYRGLGGSLGDSEAWKPQKVGGCGWTRCPRNRILSHVAQDMARAWFRGVGAHCADFGAFWRLFGPFLGHIVELKGTRGLFDTVKSSRTWSVATVSLCLAVLTGFGDRFGPKKAVLGHKMRRFGRAPPDLAPPPRAATGEFLAENRWMPQAAWEAMLADALHPLGVHPRNLPAPQDHPYVLRRLRETLQETQRDGIRLWDITQSPAPHTHTPSPPHKRRRTDTGGTHSTPGALRTTQHDAPDPPFSGAAT